MIKPIKNYILVEKELIENTSDSGIILSETKNEEKNVGKIIEIGDDVTSLNIGDKVIFESYKTKDISYNNENFLLVKDEDILAIIK